MKNLKKIFISSIYTFTTTYAIITSQYGKKCPLQCSETIDLCLEINNHNGNFQPFPPPRDALGKCFCKDEAKYLACLNCYNPMVNKELVTEVEMKIQCQIANGGAAANAGTAAAGGTKTAAAGGAKTVATTAPAAGAAAGASTAAKGKAAASTTAATKSTTSSTATASGSAKEKEIESGGSSHLGLIIVGAVAAAGVVGYVFYTRKQKERPESMPFFGNSTASPNQYATLNTPKDMSESQNSLAPGYNGSYYNDSSVNQNQYYGQGNAYGGGYDQGQSYNNQYDQNYNYNNQYPATSYENEIVGGAVGGAALAPGGAANYESRRESIMPNSQPTTTNVTGMYVVAYKYEPQLNDELELQVNDQVQIIEEYEDGWMKATNLTTGKEGMAPRVCIKEA